MTSTIDQAAAILNGLDPGFVTVSHADLDNAPRSADTPPAPTNVDPETGEIAEATPLNLAATFWDERSELTHIRQAAHAVACSPDAVLGAVLARVSASTPPSVQLASPIGADGTLDIAIALIGPSGAGKSAATKAAAKVIPITDPAVGEEPLGSGEGIGEAYMALVTEPDENGKNRKVKRQTKRGVLFELDEGQALQEMGSRRGSTLMPAIRSAWSGNRLGQANASDETKRHLAPGTYRFSLIAGFQTEKATALIDDADGGTPQRFLWLAATDPAIPDEAPDHPGALEYNPPVHQAGPMTLDTAVTQEIRARRLATVRRQTVPNPLDAHRDLSRLKVAGLLALMAQRTHITADDWRLAGDVLDASDRVRSGIISAARWRAMENERTRTAKLVRQAATLDDGATERALVSMAKSIGRHVHRQTCTGGCTRSCSMRSTASKHRKLVTIDEAIDEAVRRGWISLTGDTVSPGDEHP